MKLRLWILFLWSLIPTHFQALAEDPYKSITRHELSNGIKVILAPSQAAKTVQIRVAVQAGWSEEKVETKGVFHLLEHAMFRDKALPENMSYLQVAEENGASLNGTTSRYFTTYYGEVEGKKRKWFIDMFVKMLTRRELVDEHIEKAKQEVILEIGEPDNTIQWVLKKLQPKTFDPPDIWESEFRLPGDDDDINDIRVNTYKLSPQVVREHYEKYYHGGNIKIFVAGRFQTNNVLEQLESGFSSYPKDTGFLSKIPKPKPKKRAYKISERSDKRHSISVGALVWDLKAIDELILYVYTEYLAFQLMKEIRNEQADTYTAFSDNLFYKRYGVTGIELDVPRQKFDHYLKRLRERIKKETQEGTLTDDKVKAALELYLLKFNRLDVDSNTKMRLAQYQESLYENYGETRTPLQILNEITPETFRERLKLRYNPKHTYEYLAHPPLLFRKDKQVFTAIFIILAFFLFRLQLRSRFEHTKIKYVRKIKYSLLTQFKILVGLVLLLSASSYIDMGLFYLLDIFRLQKSLIINEYLSFIALVVIYVWILLFFFGHIPRKIMVVGDRIYIKSLSYQSRQIPVKEMTHLEVHSMFQMIPKSNFKTRFFHLSFWRPGLMLKIENGSTWYFGFKRAHEVLEELKEVLNGIEGKKSFANKVVDNEGNPGVDPHPPRQSLPTEGG